MIIPTLGRSLRHFTAQFNSVMILKKKGEVQDIHFFKKACLVVSGSGRRSPMQGRRKWRRHEYAAMWPSPEPSKNFYHKLQEDFRVWMCLSFWWDSRWSLSRPDARRRAASLSRGCRKQIYAGLARTTYFSARGNALNKKLWYKKLFSTVSAVNK